MRVLALAGTAVLLGGCYTRAPVELDTVRPNQEVRAVLSRVGRDSISRVMGRELDIVEGRVLRRAEGGVYLKVPASMQQGFQFETLYQHVFLPETHILLLERKQLDRLRTAGLIATGGAVLTALLIEQFSEEPGGTTTRPPGGPAEIRLPILRFTVP